MRSKTLSLFESYSANLEEKINKDNIEINKAIANANRGTKNAEKVRNAGYEVSNDYGSTIVKNPKTGKSVILGYDVNKDNKDKVDWKGKLDSERQSVRQTTRGNYDIKADRIPKSAKVGKTRAVGSSGKDVSVYQQNDELDSYSPRYVNDFKRSISKDINDYKKAVLNRDEKRRWADRGEEENAYYEDKVKKAQEDLDRHKKYTADYDKEAKDSEAARQAIINRVREERIRNSKNKRESEESFINHKINESAKAKKAKLLESIKARKQSIINEAAADNKYHSKSINDYEDSSELTSAINDDMSTIDNTLNELKYRVNLDETISLIDSYKDQLLQAVSDLNSTEELTETSDRELEDMEKNLRAEKVQALKDAGDKNPENTVGIAKRLPEEVWKKLKIKGDTLSAIQMIHSILAYSAEDGRTVDNIMDNRYMKSYINSLGEDTVRDLVEKELADFKERATVVNDVYTDSEGVSYNSINWKN